MAIEFQWQEEQIDVNTNEIDMKETSLITGP